MIQETLLDVVQAAAKLMPFDSPYVLDVLLKLFDDYDHNFYQMYGKADSDYPMQRMRQVPRPPTLSPSSRPTSRLPHLIPTCG